MRRPSIMSFRSLSLAVLLLFSFAGTSLAGDEDLKLRVNDAEGLPGDLVSVEIRTYAPRTIGQGQICLRAGDPNSNASSTDTAGALSNRSSRDTNEPDGEPMPLVELESYAVLSAAGDVISEGLFDGSNQNTFLVFESLSGTINQEDGPLAVLFFRISENAPIDTEFPIALEAADTYLVDSEGNELELELRPGKLKILKP